MGYTIALPFSPKHAAVMGLTTARPLVRDVCRIRLIGSLRSLVSEIWQRRSEPLFGELIARSLIPQQMS